MKEVLRGESGSASPNSLFIVHEVLGLSLLWTKLMTTSRCMNCSMWLRRTVCAAEHSLWASVEAACWGSCGFCARMHSAGYQDRTSQALKNRKISMFGI